MPLNQHHDSETGREFLGPPVDYVREYFISVATGSASVFPSTCSYATEKKLKDASPVLTRFQALTFSSSLEMTKKGSSWDRRKCDFGLRGQFLWSISQEQEISLKNQKPEKAYL